MLVNLNPQSEGAEKVNKQIEDFDNCWKKLEKDIQDKIDKVRTSLCVTLDLQEIILLEPVVTLDQ